MPLNCQTVLTIDWNQTTFVTTEALNSTLVDALVIVANSVTSNCQLASNDPACSVSSLEVYRGREEAIEISHEGFSLSDKGTIEVKNLNSTIHVITACSCIATGQGLQYYAGKFYPVSL